MSGVPTKRAESGVNSDDNCGVKGSRVSHGELSLSVPPSRREDGAEERKRKAHALRESECCLSRLNSRPLASVVASTGDPSRLT